MFPFATRPQGKGGHKNRKIDHINGQTFTLEGFSTIREARHDATTFSSTVSLELLQGQGLYCPPGGGKRGGCEGTHTVTCFTAYHFLPFTAVIIWRLSSVRFPFSPKGRRHSSSILPDFTAPVHLQGVWFHSDATLKGLSGVFSMVGSCIREAVRRNYAGSFGARQTANEFQSPPQAAGRMSTAEQSVRSAHFPVSEKRECGPLRGEGGRGPGSPPPSAKDC